jgi:hypothetical protein
LAGFEVCDLEKEGFKDYEVDIADIEGFEAVDVSFEDAVLEDRVQLERGRATLKRSSGLAIFNSIWSPIKGV